MCSKCANHSKLNKKDWGDLHDYLTSTRLFNWIMVKIFIYQDFHLSSENGEANGYGHELILLIILH